MKLLRATALVLLALTVAFSSACKKKKPKLPPATTAPTVTAPAPEPTPPPPTETKPAENPPPAPETTTTTTPVTPATKPKPKHRVTHKPKPQVPPAQPTQQATKTNGEGMTISPDLPKDEVDSQKRATEQMLQTAEANLRQLNRQLSDGEQNMVRQVRNYITQSRLATQDGDLERAHNLAVKAQLLSSELVKQ